MQQISVCSFVKLKQIQLVLSKLVVKVSSSFTLLCSQECEFYFSGAVLDLNECLFSKHDSLLPEGEKPLVSMQCCCALNAFVWRPMF